MYHDSVLVNKMKTHNHLQPVQINNIIRAVCLIGAQQSLSSLHTNERTKGQVKILTTHCALENQTETGKKRSSGRVEQQYNTKCDRR